MTTYKMIKSAYETVMNMDSREMHRYKYLCIRMLISAVHESFETTEFFYILWLITWVYELYIIN